MSTTAPASQTLIVKGINSTTTKSTLEHFFSFCGKIESIDQEGDVAKVVFVKPSAAKTALMLNGGTLDGSTLTVSYDGEDAPEEHEKTSPATEATHTETGHVDQEDKPRSAVAAEYLAHGYILSDQAIERAIAADKHYGISNRFLNFFNPLASKVQTATQPHVTAAVSKLHDVDEKRGLSAKASAAAIIGSKYYQTALDSPFGAKVHAFYTNTHKQIVDVHEEAKRIAEAKKTETSSSSDAAAPSTTTPAAAETTPAAAAADEKVKSA